MKGKVEENRGKEEADRRYNIKGKKK